MLRMQEMAFPRFKFQKFSGPPNYGRYSRMIRSDFSLDPPLGRTICLPFSGINCVGLKACLKRCLKHPGI